MSAPILLLFSFIFLTNLNELNHSNQIHRVNPTKSLNLPSNLANLPDLDSSPSSPHSSQILVLSMAANANELNLHNPATFKLTEIHEHNEQNEKQYELIKCYQCSDIIQQRSYNRHCRKQHGFKRGKLQYYQLSFDLEWELKEKNTLKRARKHVQKNNLFSSWGIPKRPRLNANQCALSQPVHVLNDDDDEEEEKTIEVVVANETPRDLDDAVDADDDDLVNVWNDAFDEFADLQKDPELLSKEFSLFKARLFYLIENDILYPLYKENAAEFHKKHKFDISIHNEILRQFLSSKSLYVGIKNFLCIWVRAESQGAAEGRVEGEVNKMKNRLSGRYRLDSYVFGMEHSIQEIMNVFKFRKEEVVEKCAKAMVKKGIYPLYKHANNTKYYPSKPISSHLAKPNIQNINGVVIDNEEFAALNQIIQ